MSRASLKKKKDIFLIKTHTRVCMYVCTVVDKDIYKLTYGYIVEDHSDNEKGKRGAT